MRISSLSKSGLAVNLLLVLGTFTSSFAPASNSAGGKWEKLKRKDLAFQAKMPGEIKEEISYSESGTTYKFSHQGEDVLFFIGATKHEVKLVNHSMLAAESLDAFAESVGGSIDHEAVWKLGKNEGLRATISISGATNATIDYRAILVGQMQYQVLAMAEGTTLSPYSEQIETYFKSFKVK